MKVEIRTRPNIGFYFQVFRLGSYSFPQRLLTLYFTGEMNEESIQAIKRPRCGLGDPPPSDQNESRRGKRYALSGARWGKQELTFR